MTICCAALMCHAPIVVPPIGGARGAACARTTRAMEALARTLVRHAPDVVVLISPHAPRRPDAWGVCADPTLRGDFGRFAAPEVGCRVAGAPAAATALQTALEERDLPCWWLAGDDLDHGALVPLWFLVEAGWRGPTLVLSPPYPGATTHDQAGAAIRQAAAASGQRWAVLASGDMSHRLTPDAPAGFDPDARRFDQWVSEHVARGDYRQAVQPDPALRERAGEDVVESLQVAAAAVGYDNQGHRLYQYEGPFGVGYLEALLYSDGADQHGTDEQATAEPPRAELLQIARESIRAALRGSPYVAPALPPPWDAPRAVFVTLRAPDGELRGCIGRTEPLHASLAEEVADCAVSAATRDPRMEPVRLAELDDLSLEISILDPPEPVRDASELDPARYGVVVSAGPRRGVLLPGVPGVDSVAQQLSIAARKGGVDLAGPHTIERFQVRKIR